MQIAFGMWLHTDKLRCFLNRKYDQNPKDTKKLCTLVSFTLRYEFCISQSMTDASKTGLASLVEASRAGLMRTL